jgi:hypothetical protein
MAQPQSRIGIGFGVTHPQFPLVLDAKVWEQVRTLLLLEEYKPEPHKPKSPTTRYVKRTVRASGYGDGFWTRNLTASDINHRFNYDGGNKILEMADAWPDHRFSPDVEPHDVFVAIIRLLASAQICSNEQLVTKEMS